MDIIFLCHWNQTGFGTVLIDFIIYSIIISIDNAHLHHVISKTKTDPNTNRNKESMGKINLISTNSVMERAWNR